MKSTFYIPMRLTVQRQYFLNVLRSPGIDSASLCSLADRYDNLIPTRFLAPIDCSKIPALIDYSWKWHCYLLIRARIFTCLWAWGPGIHSKEWVPPAYVAWGPVRYPYSTSVPSPHRLFKNSSSGPYLFRQKPEESIPPVHITRARICKRLRGPVIDSEDSILPAYVAWRARTTNRVAVPARQAGNRFVGSIKGLQIRALAGLYDKEVFVPARLAGNRLLGSLKGQCHEISDLKIFAWISFPQGLEYPFKTISSFFENSLRYWQLKVHHRCRCPVDTGGKWKKS